MASSNNTMWAYVYENNLVVKKQVPVPQIRDIDVLVKIKQVSICGSDFHIFKNDDWAKETISEGTIIGHEGCGEVIQLGSNVKNISTGDFVALESHYACEECESKGLTADNCSHYGIIGVHGTTSPQSNRIIGGVFAEYIAIPFYCCHKINEVIQDTIPLSLMEPAGNSWEIIRYIRKRGLPNNIAIYGCGPHGLNMQLFARHIGIQNIIAFEVNLFRFNFAKQFNMAHHILNPFKTSPQEILDLTNGKGFDVTIDMVGNISVVESCKNSVRDGGLIILFGLPSHEALIDHGENFSQIIFNNEEFIMNYQNKKITVRGFTGRSQQTWIELLEALNKDELLRKKLPEPLSMIGTLDKLDDIMKSTLENHLKIGMTSFNLYSKDIKLYS